MHDALHTQQRQSIAKNCVLVDVQPNAGVSELLRDIKKVTGPATEIEDVMVWAAVQGKVLGTFDVAFNPEPRVGPAMHLFDPWRIFSTEFFPRRIFFKLLQKLARIDLMEGAMNMLAQTADDVGIEKLSQFVREIHGGLSLIITVIPSEVEGSRCKSFKATSSESLGPNGGGTRFRASRRDTEVAPTFSEDRNDITHGDKFLHPRGVPVGGTDAPVTGCATDRFGLIRSVNADMRFA
jgi:hypothetical protein